MYSRPMIIAVAPNGARKTRSDHPNLPISAADLAATAARCADRGASMIHLHVRDLAGRHTLDADAYAAATAAIRRSVGDRLVIQLTSESVGRYTPDQQIDHMKRARPEAVSISLRELVPDDDTVAAAADFFEWLRREGSVPQYILFSLQDVARYRELLNSGAIPSVPHWLLLVLGRYDDGFAADPLALLPFLTDRGITVPWAVCAFGRAEHVSASCAAVLGGHARVGFENNLFLKNGEPADSNDQLVGQVSEVAQAIGRPVADAHALREMFKVK